jgi:hypothetical protein
LPIGLKILVAPLFDVYLDPRYFFDTAKIYDKEKKIIEQLFGKIKNNEDVQQTTTNLT